MRDCRREVVSADKGDGAECRVLKVVSVGKDKGRGKEKGRWVGGGRPFRGRGLLVNRGILKT